MLFVFNKIHIKVPPKKLLPTSPINILDGCQFHSKNPNKAPAIPHNDSDKKNVEKMYIVIKQLMQLLVYF